VGGHEGPVEESPAGLVWRMQQPLLVSGLAEERRWPKVTGRMKEDGVDSFCFVPLTTAVRRLGAMGFLSLQKEAYGETDLEFLQQVGKQVAVAVDNVLNFASSEAAQQSLARERDWLSLVLEINNAVVSHLELRELLKAISACLRGFVSMIPRRTSCGLMRSIFHAIKTLSRREIPFRWKEPRKGWRSPPNRQFWSEVSTSRSFLPRS
jgi:formate hydrogenlyase transcriptional activator